MANARVKRTTSSDEELDRIDAPLEPPKGLRRKNLVPEAVSQFHETLRHTLAALNSGDPSVRMPNGLSGAMGEISFLLNAVITKNQSFTQELTRVSGLVGREGRLGERASLINVEGFWAANVESVNSLIGELARPTTEIARVIQAVAKGDLSQKITVEARGEIRDLKETINTMVDTLRSFASEVTRVAKEVGTEGKLGGLADVKGVSGTWKELTGTRGFKLSHFSRFSGGH